MRIQYWELGGSLDLNEFADVVLILEKMWHSRWPTWCADDEGDSQVQSLIMSDIQACTDRHDVAVAWLTQLCSAFIPGDDRDERGLRHCKQILIEIGIVDLAHDIDELANEIQTMPYDEPEEYLREEVQYRQSRDRIYPIDSQFLASETWEVDWKHRYVKISFNPSKLLNPTKRIAIHLYSGRRRKGDYQWWYEGFRSTGDCEFLFLSIDTAVDASMNINDEKLWTFILDSARAGRVESLMLGPPCETWSAARYHDLGSRGPRPLRSAQRPWGLLHRSIKEILQLQVGTSLLLKGLLLTVVVALGGGATILEHPAEPAGPDKQDLPSIWKTAVLRILLDFFPQFEVVTIQQWKYGACGVKPTSFLFANNCLRQWLPQWEIPAAMKPLTPLIGKGTDGNFRTTAAKEYPRQLNAALAYSASRGSGVFGCETAAQDWPALALELNKLGSYLEGGSMQPDYQPQC